MFRKNIRLRREYIYRKSLEGKERMLYEKKRKIKEALEDNYLYIPRENQYRLSSEMKRLLSDRKLILKTNSQLVCLLFPNSQRMNRGGQVISEIIETCRAHDFTDVRGVPDGLIISHLPFGPTAYFGLLNVVTRYDIKDKKDIGTMPEAYPHLILNNFSTKLGERTANILKHMFPVPKADSKRIITFTNQADYISFRNHIYEKRGGPKSVELKEVGPRFELRLYQIKLGTKDQTEAETEWVIRPYMNTSKKQKILGD